MRLPTFVTRTTATRAPLVFAALVLLPLVASAATRPAPLHWAKSGFAHHGQAIEHITLRGADAHGRSTFIRFSLANAAYKKGRLDITVLQRNGSKKGIYAKKSFKRGQYTIFKDRFGLVAGQNRLEFKDGKIMMTFKLGKLTGTAELKLRGRSLRLRDRGPSGWIERTLMTPWGTLTLDLSQLGGVHLAMQTTVFAVHESSTIKAHRTYDRSVQIHHVRGGRATVVDYIVAPKERHHRPLGFVILHGGGQHFVGRVTREKRTAERLDRHNDYRVPWLIDVEAERGKRTASVHVAVRRQIKRKDDLAGLGFFTRKAVSLLIHPYTYTLVGDWRATIATKPSPVATAAVPAAAVPTTAVPTTAVPTTAVATAAVPALTGSGEVRYAQTRE